jgi:hypothetical protein
MPARCRCQQVIAFLIGPRGDVARLLFLRFRHRVERVDKNSSCFYQKKITALKLQDKYPDKCSLSLDLLLKAGYATRNLMPPPT